MDEPRLAVSTNPIRAVAGTASIRRPGTAAPRWRRSREGRGDAVSTGPPMPCRDRCRQSRTRRIAPPFGFSPMVVSKPSRPGGHRVAHWLLSGRFRGSAFTCRSIGSDVAHRCRCPSAGFRLQVMRQRSSGLLRDLLKLRERGRPKAFERHDGDDGLKPSDDDSAPSFETQILGNTPST